LPALFSAALTLTPLATNPGTNKAATDTIAKTFVFLINNSSFEI
jgi:hypothetical protein